MNPSHTEDVLSLQVKYLLEQMRLSVARADYVRASIIAKKISTRFFESSEDEVGGRKTV